jgi:hypothetical protein
MGKIEPHINSIWNVIDDIILFILENDKYLAPKRAGDLTKHVMDKYDVADRTARGYISEARKYIRSLKKMDKSKNLDRAVRRRELIAQKAIESKDYKLLLEVEKDLSKLFGLYVDEVKHSGTISINNIDLSKLTDEQLSILESIIKKGEDPKPYLLSVGINVKSN